MDVGNLFNDYQQVVWTWFTLTGFGIAVQSLPPPRLVDPNPFYVFVYNFAQGIANNYGLIKKETTKRTIMREAILDTGTGTGDGTAKEIKEAIAVGKKEILEISKAKIDAQAAAPLQGV